jgi:hypothetical protein
VRNKISKKIINVWIEKMWIEQQVRSTIYFNLWGYLCKNFDKAIKYEDLYSQLSIKLHDQNDIFEEDDPDNFLENFGGRNAFLSSEWINLSATKFFNHNFSDEITTSLLSSEDVEIKIGQLIFMLFMLYSTPQPFSPEACLILNHHAQCIYDIALLFLVSHLEVSNRFKRTHKMNFKKKRRSLIIDEIIEVFDRIKTENSVNYKKLSNSRKAKIMMGQFNKFQDIINNIIKKIDLENYFKNYDLEQLINILGVEKSKIIKYRKEDPLIVKRKIIEAYIQNCQISVSDRKIRQKLAERT